VDIENAWFDIRQELPKLRDKHQRVIALFTQNGCTIDDVESCVDLLRDERLRVEFNDTFKDFLDTLDTILSRREALPYVKDAKKLGLIKKSVADLYRDEKQVRELGYRWGSCGHRGDLYFHWRVAMLPRTMIEYVVVHELVHLIEPHHTTAFWDRVERILSDGCDAYGGLRLRKQWLAENGATYDL
jgi:hypothetical protein